jgi:hypothetical protein
MWTLTNETPYAAERCWVRDKDGAEVWLVAVRGTFLIRRDGSTEVASEQVPVCVPPVYRAAPAESSLLYDSDLHHTKVNTDVLLDGHAHAPRGHSVTHIDVRLKVSNIDKTLRVFGDRVWKNGVLGPTLSEAAPFTRMPLTYERAFGGRGGPLDAPDANAWDARNPVGVGYALRPSDLAGRAAPNIESPGQPISHWNDRPEPAGFGPLAGHWAARARWAGTYDGRWLAQRQPLLPEDFDERFYQCAPVDQQASGFLLGGEVVELSGMTPDGVLAFRLPRQTLGFTTDFEDGSSQVHRSRLHTVIIEPDHPRVTLVWHSQLPCHHRVLKLKTTHIRLKRRIGPPQAQGTWAVS